ncbi:hypothetical protein PLICRDRAFT_529278 [Plicaturopsis crispa FD-325 SS-3]|nr:hypothetical protein PLICRDRAFT_529278 [Plicaturopsis crispa FD-325 SS-3]
MYRSTTLSPSPGAGPSRLLYTSSAPLAVTIHCSADMTMESLLHELSSRTMERDAARKRVARLMQEAREAWANDGSESESQADALLQENRRLRKANRRLAAENQRLKDAHARVDATPQSSDIPDDLHGNTGFLLQLPSPAESSAFEDASTPCVSPAPVRPSRTPTSHSRSRKRNRAHDKADTHTDAFSPYSASLRYSSRRIHFASRPNSTCPSSKLVYKTSNTGSPRASSLPAETRRHRSVMHARSPSPTPTVYFTAPSSPQSPGTHLQPSDDR